LNRRQQTIHDFGNQWKIHGRLNPSHWTSIEMFVDYLARLMDPHELKGRNVLEVGSGSGRILRMLSAFHPAELIGVEPSAGFEVLKQNTSDLNNLKLMKETGSSFVAHELDYIFSLGVIHHIPEPESTVQNVYNSLKVNGKFVIWVYGYEGNQIYITLYKLLSLITKKMKDSQLDKLSDFLQKIVVGYGVISKKLFLSKLPMSDYILNVFSPCGALERK